MKLKNEFPTRVRYTFLHCYECQICGTNGSGMLELHHIKGRESSSALNAAVVCHDCHVHLNHNDKEEESLMIKTVKFLVRNDYEFKANDLKFYNKYKNIYDKYEREGGIYTESHFRVVKVK